MADESLIKSASRVKEHGEVFTPKWVVDKMLSQPEIKPALNSLTATFLEPAAGEGAFLIEILHRKLELANQLSNSVNEYNDNILTALMSLYGIELLEDNVEMLVMNMYGEFFNEYIKVITKYAAPLNKEVVASAKTIISANMVQGDTLKKITSNGDPIIFSEWKLLPIKRGVQKVKRTEYTLESILNDGDSYDGPNVIKFEEMDLFSDFDEQQNNIEKSNKFEYIPVKLVDIYKELVSEA